MIHEMQKDQKPEEVQISFKEYVDHAKVVSEGHHELHEGCTRHLVLT